jgi:hypothetical protein
LASSPQSAGERFLWDVSYMLGRVDFAAVWTAQAAPPHSVNQPQRDVAHEKDDNSEHCCIGVDDENEIVKVDHLLGVPRASARLLWIAVWIVSGIHRLYWPTYGINLPRTKNARFFYRPQNVAEKRRKNLGLATRSRCLLGLKNLIRVSDLHKTLQQ